MANAIKYLISHEIVWKLRCIYVILHAMLQLLQLSRRRVEWMMELDGLC